MPDRPSGQRVEPAAELGDGGGAPVGVVVTPPQKVSEEWARVRRRMPVDHGRGDAVLVLQGAHQSQQPAHLGGPGEDLLVGKTSFSKDLHINNSRPMTIVKIDGGKVSSVGVFDAEKTPEIKF